MQRSRQEAMAAAERLTQYYGPMAVWEWLPGLWTFAPVTVAPKDGTGMTKLRREAIKKRNGTITGWITTYWAPSLNRWVTIPDRD